jgi:hypothetical protein
MMILTTRGPNDGMDHYALWLAFFNLIYPYGYFDPKIIVRDFLEYPPKSPPPMHYLLWLLGGQKVART